LKKSIKYSVVCCISDKEIFNDCLLKSIKKQKRLDIEYVPIFNYSGIYNASQALNAGREVARGDYIIYAHQDIALLPGSLEKLDNLLTKDIKIIGAAGIDLKYGSLDIGSWGGKTQINQKLAVGTVYNDDDEFVSKAPYWNGVKEATAVHCIDECFFAASKDIKLKFDESLDGFHFYGIDYSLQARKAGYDVYSADIPIIHYGKYSTSMGKNNRYWKILRYLYTKWSAAFPELLTTHMNWNLFGEVSSQIGFRLKSDDGIEVQVLGVKYSGLISK